MTDPIAPPDATPARTRRLVDESTGQPVQLVYALPPDLLGGGLTSRSEHGPGEMALRLWRRRRAILAIVAASLVVSVVVALSLPATYTASVTAMPPAQRGGAALGALGQYADLASLAGISLPASGSAVEEIMAILNSRTLQQRLVEEFDLRGHFHAALLQDALKSFDDAFTATYDKKANTISFALTTRIGTEQIPDAAKLAAIVNRAAVEVQSIFNGIHQSSSRREREFLESRRNDVEKELSEAQEKLATFQREHGTIELEAQAKATVEALSALQGQLIGQEVELRALLASQASADNPNIRLLQERIGGLNDAIRKISGTSTAGDAGDVLLHLGSLPQLGIQYVNLLREVKKDEAMLQALLAQVEAARFNELRSAEAISIIDAAVPPERRTAPKRSAICILGGLLGVIAAAVWALSAEPVAAWWRSVRVEVDAARPAPA